VIEEDHEPPQPGPFAFLGGSTHKVPTVTWMPGQAGPERHRPSRPRSGCSTPPGRGLPGASATSGARFPRDGAITQDHPRRGLVVLVPADADNRAVMDWLLRAATLVCTVPTTGRWLASVHAGLPTEALRRS
jgi:hypothetical protein